jgi:hypothetical protein
MTNFEKWKSGLTAENCERFMLAVLQQVFPDFKLTIPKEASEKFLAWANAETDEEETKYIVRCEADVGACMFSSFWNGRTFEKGEENAKVFHRRESAEEELNRFGYSKRDYSILKTTEL